MYRVFPIASPVSQSMIAAYKSLRLMSLQHDPSCFSSSYDREITFTDEEWQGRISSPYNSKRTFIASAASEVSHDTPYAPSGDIDEREDKDTWIGTVTILGPSELLPLSALAPLEKAGVGTDWALYFLVAMWVHPEHRDRGVGYELIKQGLEWVRGHRDSKWTDGKAKMVLLLVHDHNARGRGLYMKAGFEDFVQMPIENGERWMFLKI